MIPGRPMLTGPGRLESDFQTSRLTANDSGWTTRGAPEGQGGGVATYENAHLSRKLYWSETMAVVALRLADGPGEDLDAIDAALDLPAPYGERHL